MSSHPVLQELHSVLTAHQSNIFSAKFLPTAEGEGVRLVSCAGIGSVEYSEISPVGQYVSHPFQCHRSITYQVKGSLLMNCPWRPVCVVMGLSISSVFRGKVSMGTASQQEVVW